MWPVYHNVGDVPGTVCGGTPRSNVSMGIDGNVAVMRTPGTAKTIQEFSACFAAQISKMARAAKYVVILFDEPDAVPLAKVAEQRRRDSLGKRKVVVSSDDFVCREGSPPLDDNYDSAKLEQVHNCHEIIRHRPAKARFFDEIVRRAYPMILDRLRADEATCDTVLIIDGLDERGSERPIGEPRRCAIRGSCTETINLFYREETIGEGDLKLAWLGDKVRTLVEAESLSIKLHLTVTIDTDSIPIELLDVARRGCEPEPKHRVIGLLCMQDRSEATANQLEDAPESTPFLVCNYEALYVQIQEHMWRDFVKQQKRQPTPEEERMVMSLVAAGWALAGCDFAKLKGFNAEMVMEVVPAMVRNLFQYVKSMRFTWQSDDRQLAASAAEALHKMVAMAETDRSKSVVSKLRSKSHDDLLKAIWTVCYWNRCEFRGRLDEFGFADAVCSVDLAEKQSNKRQREERSRQDVLNWFSDPKRPAIPA